MDLEQLEVLGRPGRLESAVRLVLRDRQDQVVHGVGLDRLETLGHKVRLVPRVLQGRRDHRVNVAVQASREVEALLVSPV